MWELLTVRSLPPSKNAVSRESTINEIPIADLNTENKTLNLRYVLLIITTSRLSVCLENVS